MHRTFRLALPALACLIFASCGGEDGPSKEEFAKQANTICKDIEKGSKASSQPRSLDDIVTVMDKARKTLTTGVDRMKKLELPAGEDGKQAQQFVVAFTGEFEKKVVPALDKFKKAAREKDQKALQSAAQDLQKVDARRSGELARAIGANDCAA